MTYVVTVRFILHADQRQAFLEEVKANALQSIDRESGCQQFDVSTASDGRHVFLYERYDDKRDFDLHLSTAHFQEFDRATASMVIEKRVECFVIDS